MTREEKITASIMKSKAQRAANIDQLKRAKEFIENKAKTATLPELEARLVVVEKAYKLFQDSQLDLESLDNEELTGDVRSNFEELYLVVKPSLQVFINQLRTNLSGPNNSVASERFSVKLPKCEITPFAGDRKKWFNFFESFNKLIHSNPGLSDIARFGYLKSLVVHPAIKTIESLELTSENYAEAITLLRNRYQNKKLICEDHIREIFSLKSITKPTAENIRHMLDTVNSNLRALSSLQRPTPHWDDLIIHLLCSKLDPDTRSKWDDEAAIDRMPTLGELINFLNKRCHSLESQVANSNKSNSVSMQASNTTFTHSRKSSQHVSLAVQSNGTCNFCKLNNHQIYKCKQFISLPVAERKAAVNHLALCINCLRADHLLAACTSRFICFQCKQQHHSLLHDFAEMNVNQNNQSFSSHTLQCQKIQLQPEQQHQEQLFTPPKPITSENHILKPTQNTQPQSSTSASTTIMSSTHQTFQSNTTINNSYVYLSTALVKVYDKNGVPVIGRALLDSASQAHIITEAFAAKLGLTRKQISSSIRGINDKSTSSNSAVNLRIRSCTSDFNALMDAQILTNITSSQPAIAINTSDWKIPENIRLADPNFAIPQKIDLLIGAELYLTILSIGQIELAANLPHLQNTQLGWIVAGKITNFAPTVSHSNVATTTDEPVLDSLLERFWNVESAVTPKHNYTQMELACENHFAQNTSRDNSGRFIVSLPLTCSPTALGNSQTMATRRFLNLEKRLSKDNELKHSYTKFLIEYENLGHMVPISESEIAKVHYFIPHHCVFKNDSSTTKIRVVFDASAKTDTGKSLNDIMMVGPVIQSDLFSILLRFRTHRYVISADITKMYRQIRMNEADTHLQYIVWRNTTADSLRIFRLTTVTYGMAASSYLATKCLSTIAETNSCKYPEASAAIRHDVYVDDLLTGGATINEIKRIKDHVVQILQEAGMELRKWCSNDNALIADIDDSDRDPYLCIDDTDYVKTLGLYWLPQSDHFRFKVADFDPDKPITKRIILSEVARLFDPLGYTGPVITLGKLFIQDLWRLKIHWDSALPQNLYSKWQNFRAQLMELNKLLIPRFLQYNLHSEVQIHGFSDASEVAYGAAIYVRSSRGDDETYFSCLLCSKSRIAPTKRETLPRLELCAAELLVNLMKRVIPALRLHTAKFFYWTDSSIVLHWIASETSHLKTFVANRVSTIQQYTNASDWHYVPSSENPADLISRGMEPSMLAGSSLWFHGPEFLTRSEGSWPKLTPQFTGENEVLECKIPKSSMVAEYHTSGFTDLYNSIKYKHNYRSLINVISFILRFAANSKCKKENRILLPKLSVAERENGLSALMKMIQREAFAEEYQQLKHGKPISKRSHLNTLSPFLDENNIIRVGGRLSHATLSYAIKHPILLPSSHPFTILLLNHLHLKFLHAGPQALLAASRQQFWPLSGRHLAQKVVNQCFTCRRVHPRNIVQFMGHLPTSRISISLPFTNVGIDYCGPFCIHYKLRGKRPTKAYLCIFVCFATKAVHFELVTELTTSAFIGALKRFIATRGICKHIWSDNATNFVGANNELHQLFELFSSQCHKEDIRKLCEEDKITWHFAPPYSPHFGGIYEAAVKSAKYLLRRVMGNASLTFEELNTLIKQAEAVLNSRPLYQMSNDPSDLQALTPGHFLIGRPITSILEPDVEDHNLPLMKRWNLVQQIHQHFWARWSSEYLLQLQQRKSWTKASTILSCGDLVLIKDDNLPPLKWRMGRILQLHPGKDGITRVVTVKTQNGELKRATSRICPLPSEPSDVERPASFKAAEYVEAQQN